MKRRRSRARTSCRGLVAVALLASGGCAATATPRPTAAHPALAPSPPRASGARRELSAAAAPLAAPRVRRAALRFELDERPFPSPLVDAVVGGQPTTLIVDTGASHHVIARWLAEELAVPLANAGDVGIDHAGHQVQVSRLERASVSIAGWGALDEPSLLVVPVPDVLRRLGIGGFVAPQTLSHRGRAVVLDLRDGSMTESPRDEAVRDLEARFGAGALVELRACGGDGRGRELTATASVEGMPVTLKIDSGASQSSLFATSPAGRRLSPRAAGGRSAYAASGKHTVPVLSGTHVRLGSLEATADIDLLPGGSRPTCPTDGFAGMDVLRGCALVLAEDGGIAACARE